MLAAGALVASLFAVGAAPAAAIDEDSMQDHKSTFTACLGPAMGDAGFTDIDGLGAEADINCLAYYGITTGKPAGSDTFDPNSDVTRSQMALFLYRTAGLMGVDLMGGDMAANFGDIADQGEDRQNAITALARNGILTGRGMAFEPDAAITRAEMAVALVSLVDHVSSNLRKNDDGLFVFGDDEEEPDDSFGDAYSLVSQPINNAISAAYELGITTGKPAGSNTFDPHGTVPRKNMASFITRALAHSNVRPAGMTAQVQTRPMGAAEVVVSMRDADFAPVVNAAIDAFRTPAAQEDRAFKQDGTCSSRTSLIDGATKCTIDGADPVTTSLGNIGLAQLSKADIDKGLTVWLWTGDVGDKFGNSTDALEISVNPQPETAAAASVAAISSDLGLKGAGDARYGQTVTFTIQLQDGEENDAATPSGGVKYNLRLEMFSSRVAVGSTADTVSRTPGEVELASDGSGTFTVTARDLDSNNDSEVTVRYTLSRSVVNEDSSASAAVTTALLVPGTATATSAEVQPATTPATYRHTKAYQGIVVFSDSPAKVTSVSVGATSHQSAPSGSNPVGTAATATVLDQYGRPMEGEGIVLTGGANATVSTRPRFTGPNGQVRIGYSYSGGAAVQTVTAIWNGDTADTDGDGTLETGEGGDDDTGCSTGPTDTTNLDLCGTTMVFWVGVVLDENSTVAGMTTAEQANDITGPADVLSHDADNQQIVIDSDDDADDDGGRAPAAMNYDSNDFYTVDGSPTTMADFAEMLTKALATYQAAADDDSGSAEVEPTLQWSGYVFDDSSSSTWFQLTSNLTVNEGDLP